MEVKKILQDFQSYQTKNINYSIKLDANESVPNNNLKPVSINLSLYPDNYNTQLREELAKKYNVEMDEVIVGSGSSELLELVAKTYLNPNDFVLSIEPSFSMYKKYTQMHYGKYVGINTDKNYQTDMQNFINQAKKYQPKIIYLCTPNNPTGVMVDPKDIIQLLETVDTLVVVDEAYMEFTTKFPSMISYINKYDNLIVNRTFSKSYGLAGVRLGYFIANKKLIQQLRLCKTPYSVTSYSSLMGIQALQDDTFLKQNITRVKTERERLQKIYDLYPFKTIESEANFFFIQCTIMDLEEALLNKGILIRSLGNHCYRITIGSTTENNFLIEALKEIFYEYNNPK